jgi:hypothetical protein
MNARKWRLAGATAALLLVPLIAAGDQHRAIRHSGLNCYLSGGFNAAVFVDLAAMGGAVHDWGIGSKGTPEQSVVYCPVALDVPREDGKNPVEKVRILYSTRALSEMTGANPSTVIPEVKGCTAYLMDGTGTGTWVGNAASSMGGTRANLYDDDMIEIGGASATLGSVTLRRMVIICNMSRGTALAGSIGNTFTSLIKGYEVQYIESPPSEPPP